MTYTTISGGKKRIITKGRMTKRRMTKRRMTKRRKQNKKSRRNSIKSRRKY